MLIFCNYLQIGERSIFRFFISVNPLIIAGCFNTTQTDEKNLPFHFSSVCHWL